MRGNLNIQVETMFIDGIGLSNYRSFGPEIQYLGPFSKINLLVGQNNSGKSNVLSFLTNHFEKLMQAGRSGSFGYPFAEIDKHIGKVADEFRIAFGLRLGGKNYNEILDRINTALSNRNVPGLLDSVKSILTSPLLSPDGIMAWFEYTNNKLSPHSSFGSEMAQRLRGANVISSGHWNNIWAALTSQSGGDAINHWIPQTLATMSPVTLDSPEIAFVPAIRRIGKRESKPTTIAVLI